MNKISSQYSWLSLSDRALKDWLQLAETLRHQVSHLRSLLLLLLCVYRWEPVMEQVPAPKDNEWFDLRY